MQAKLRRLGSVVWPAFLGAGALEALVFAFVDPQSLHLPGGGTIALSPTAVYSLAFFAFWALVAGACTLTLMLERGAGEINAEAPGAPGSLTRSDR
jgi:hypothetical protein